MRPESELSTNSGMAPTRFKDYGISGKANGFLHPRSTAGSVSAISANIFPRTVSDIQTQNGCMPMDRLFRYIAIKAWNYLPGKLRITRHAKAIRVDGCQGELSTIFIKFNSTRKVLEIFSSNTDAPSNRRHLLLQRHPTVLQNNRQWMLKDAPYLVPMTIHGRSSKLCIQN